MKSIFQQLTSVGDDTEQRLQSPCWLTQFSRLNELSESNDVQTDNHLLETIKAITECLRPLKVPTWPVATPCTLYNVHVHL